MRLVCGLKFTGFDKSLHTSRPVLILCQTVPGIESADMQAREQSAQLMCKVLQGKLPIPLSARIRLASRFEQRVRRDSRQSTLLAAWDRSACILSGIEANASNFQVVSVVSFDNRMFGAFSWIMSKNSKMSSSAYNESMPTQ